MSLASRLQGANPTVQVKDLLAGSFSIPGAKLPFEPTNFLGITTIEGTTTNDVWSRIAKDSAGNFFVIFADSTWTSAYLLKLGPKMDFIWGRKITKGVGGYLYYWDLFVDASDNVYATCTNTSVGGVYQTLVIKYNSAGTRQLHKQIAVGSYDIGGQAVCTDGTDIYVTGLSYNSGLSTSTDGMTFKISDAGAVIGNLERFGGSGSGQDQANNILVYSSKAYIFSRLSVNNPIYPVIIQKNSANLDGNNWSYYLNRGGDAYGLAQNGGFIYMASSAYNSGNDDTMLAKFNTSGTPQWTKTLRGSSQNLYWDGKSIAFDSSGNVYVSGRSSGTIIVAKYNSSGTLQWQRSFTGVSTWMHGGIEVSGDFYYIASSKYLIKAPIDGSGTGSLGSGISYNVTTYTDGSINNDQWINASSILFGSSNTFTSTDSSHTYANMTSSNYSLQKLGIGS